ncbi:RHS repeat-associated core domain-containing protein, partial [Acidovorax sp. SUPP950]|uniref:RHS repeat-associated core domain-containing protein n=1 Tax=Acidovorax sp. SUPP950 TaxID=511901 RepID=UPI0024E0EF6E
GRLYAIDADHLNTPRRLTNTQGQVVWQWLITGFGEANPTTGATGYAQSGQGSSNYAEAIKFDLRYPGQVFDEETGLNYNLNRSYDPPSGRYFQADPIGLDGGWNRFGYVGGDPLNAIDPQGLNAVLIANRAAAWVQSAYYRYGPAITEFIAGASGVNGAVVSPMSPLVAQIPTTVSRMTPVARAVAEGVESGGFCSANGVAQSVANGPRLAQQLAYSEAASIFTSGGLRADVIATSKVAIPGGQLQNPVLVRTLTSEGGLINDWAKMTTQSYNSPSGPFQVHFYQNLKTGALYFSDDFKVIFNHNGGW